MFAIAFDLRVAEIRRHHPKGISQASSDVEQILARFNFAGKQGSVYLTDDESLVNLMNALLAPRNLPWFPKVGRDLRAFRVEQWSDFTDFVKTG